MSEELDGVFDGIFGETVERAQRDGKHATCRFDPALMPNPLQDPFVGPCNWTGPATDLLPHDWGHWVCPSGHGGNWLAFHAEGDPAAPLPPRWHYTCPACHWCMDSTEPLTACLNCHGPVQPAEEPPP